MSNICNFNISLTERSLESNVKSGSLDTHSRKLREAWRLAFSSDLPSKGDGEP